MIREDIELARVGSAQPRVSYRGKRGKKEERESKQMNHQSAKLSPCSASHRNFLGYLFDFGVRAGRSTRLTTTQLPEKERKKKRYPNIVC